MHTTLPVLWCVFSLEISIYNQVNNETVETDYGPVLSDGTASSCSDTDCAQFKGPAYRYLNLLNSVSSLSAYEDVLLASVQSLEAEDLQIDTGLYGPAWQGPAPASTTVINNAEESAAVMAIAISSL